MIPRIHAAVLLALAPSAGKNPVAKGKPAPGNPPGVARQFPRLVFCHRFIVGLYFSEPERQRGFLHPPSLALGL
jgi:hypothetical protein